MKNGVYPWSLEVTLEQDYIVEAKGLEDGTVESWEPLDTRLHYQLVSGQSIAYVHTSDVGILDVDTSFVPSMHDAARCKSNI